ncbi:hypothetical protein [Caballeronia glebae]|uniref:hypothetical protein n=1 Tax=Caballeronia glebae TaxID=1777143 RepID=UPI000B35262A
MDVVGASGAGVTLGDALCKTGGAVNAEFSTIGAGERGVDVHPVSHAVIPATSAMPAIAARGFDPKPFLCITTSFLMLVVLNFFTCRPHSLRRRLQQAQTPIATVNTARSRLHRIILKL